MKQTTSYISSNVSINDDMKTSGAKASDSTGSGRFKKTFIKLEQSEKKRWDNEFSSTKVGDYDVYMQGIKVDDQSKYMNGLSNIIEEQPKFEMVNDDPNEG